MVLRYYPSTRGLGPTDSVISFLSHLHRLHKLLEVSYWSFILHSFRRNRERPSLYKRPHHSSSEKFTCSHILDSSQSTNRPESILFFILKNQGGLIKNVSQSLKNLLCSLVCLRSVSCDHLVTTDHDGGVFPTSPCVAKKKSEKKKAREPCGVKANTAVGFRVRTSATDPFRVGCVNDTQRSQRAPLKGM